MKTTYIFGSVILGILVVLGLAIGLVAGGVVGTGTNKLVITSGSMDVVYNGEALTCDEWALAEGSLLEGHTLQVSVLGSQTDVGESPNTVSVTVLDAVGADVTGDYIIESVPGTLRVQSRALGLATVNASKQYDGDPLTGVSYQIRKGSLAGGHALQVAMNAERVEVGETENTVIARVVNRDGVDVTHNYEISYVEGDLVVTPHAITVQSGSLYVTYDGTEKTLDGAELIAGSLLDGHSMVVIMTGKITDVGTVENTFGVDIVDGEGNSVAQNYTVTTVFGDLTVRPRPITVSSANDSKMYDGTELKNSNWSVSSIIQLVEGHTLEARVTGSRTEIGESDNTIAQCVITDGTNDVTHNYAITLELGKLIVTQPINVPGNDDDEGLDDSGQIGGGGSPQTPVLVAKVKSDETHTAYLRTWSRGNYNGSSWGTNPPVYGELINGVYSMNYLTGLALQNAGYSPLEMIISPVQSPNYLLPYYMQASTHSYTVQSSDVRYTTADPSADYALYYYAYNHKNAVTPLSALPAEYAAAELSYRSFVYENYLAVPAQTLAFMQDIIAEKNFEKDDPHIVRAVASYIQNAAKYNLEYPQELDDEADIVVAFLSTYKEGICQHYASAATLLFRALGIPARYTEGYVVNAVAGQWVELTSETAHAWVEIYLDGVGWVYVEVTGGADGSSEDDSTETPPTTEPIVVRPATERYQVDEKDRLVPLQLYSTNDWHLKMEAEGYRFTYELEGEQVGVGRSASRVVNFRIWLDDEDVTDAVMEEHNVTVKEGTLHVYVAELNVFGGGAQKLYDGFPLLPDQSDYTHSALISADHVLQVFFTEQLTNAGEILNLYTAKVVDSVSGEDVSDQYYIHRSYGTLSVTKRHIVVKADGARKAYDGTPLTCSTYTMSGDALCEGHQITVVITGEAVERGSRVANVVESVTICDKYGNNVDKNYSVEYESDWLIIT